MAMTPRILGIRPSDEQWQKMYEVYKACDKAEVSIPEEVKDFFQGEFPNSSGVIVDLLSTCVHHSIENGLDVYEIDLKRLPNGIKIIRFSNR